MKRWILAGLMIAVAAIHLYADFELCYITPLLDSLGETQVTTNDTIRKAKYCYSVSTNILAALIYQFDPDDDGYEYWEEYLDTGANRWFHSSTREEDRHSSVETEEWEIDLVGYQWEKTVTKSHIGLRDEYSVSVAAMSNNYNWEYEIEADSQSGTVNSNISHYLKIGEAYSESSTNFTFSKNETNRVIESTDYDPVSGNRTEYYHELIVDAYGVLEDENTRVYDANNRIIDFR